MVLPARKQLVTRGELRPAQGGAEDTEERVYSMVSLLTSSRDKLWRAMLSCSVSAQPKAGFLVKLMRSIPTNSVGQTCERVGDCGSHVKRVLTSRRKDTVTLNEEQVEVSSVAKDKTTNDVWRAEHRCQGDDVNMVMMERDEVPSGREGNDVDCRR